MAEAFAWLVIGLAILVAVSGFCYFLHVLYYRIKLGNWSEAAKASGQQTKRVIRRTVHMLDLFGP